MKSDRVRDAAAAEGRVFAFMCVFGPWIIHIWDNNVWTRYDMSGAVPDKIQIILEHSRTLLPRVTCSTRIQRPGTGITRMDTLGRGKSLYDTGHIHPSTPCQWGLETWARLRRVVPTRRVDRTAQHTR